MNREIVMAVATAIDETISEKMELLTNKYKFAPEDFYEYQDFAYACFVTECGFDPWR